MLEAIDFKQTLCVMPTLDILEPSLVEQFVEICSRQDQVQSAGVYCNVKKLHQLLTQEVIHRNGTSVNPGSAYYQVRKYPGAISLACDRF